ncbi:hypothetical protein HOC13_04825 [Candidatus Woesearchaeota archaeon]|jgi:hypothetical protein|nr:hypothetical protein [Candidatus Woesearchaeota archaeon]
MVSPELLIQHGFVKGLYKKGVLDQSLFNQYYDFKEGAVSLVNKSGLKDLKPDEEVWEEVQEAWVKTGYPSPRKRFRLIWEVYDLSIEESYYWVLKYLRHDAAHPVVEKLEDTFSAAEASASFGVTQQRLGAQQDKVSQFLVAIGKMVKELFAMVRELRIIDERKGYYQETEEQMNRPRGQRLKGGETTLKGVFIDMVQGGAKSAASVYGMARELEFVTLPDLFFEAPPFVNSYEMEEWVDNLEFNEKVKRVLKRHLKNFMEWKKSTWKELKGRRKFQLQYLRQHFDIIKLYMEWTKPYLRNIQRLGIKKEHMASPDIIAAFEGSMIDIELLARRPFGDPKAGGCYACVVATLNYRTRPQMKFIQEGYQRGPVHQGKMEMNVRGYIWNEAQVQAYKNMKDRESFELLKVVSASVTAAMEALGDELFGYLEEAGEDVERKGEEKAVVNKGLIEKLFGDFIVSKGAKKVKRKKVSGKDEGAWGAAENYNKLHLWNVHNNFKKAHRLIAW